MNSVSEMGAAVVCHRAALGPETPRDSSGARDRRSRRDRSATCGCARARLRERNRSTRKRAAATRARQPARRSARQRDRRCRRASSARSTSGRTAEGRAHWRASSIPAGAAEVCEGGCVKAPAQSLERGLLRVDLGALGRGDRARVAFDDAVLDVHIRRTRGKSETVRNDMTVRDVKLASVERSEAASPSNSRLRPSICMRRLPWQIIGS